MNAAAIAEWIRTARVRTGLSQTEVSQRAGVSIRTLRDLERGRIRSPRPDTTRRLADVLGPAPESGPWLLVLGPLQAGLNVEASPLRRTLLAYLALRSNEWVTADELTEILWPGAAAANSGRLHSQVSRLRAALGPTPVLESAAGRYRLLAAAADVDLLSFRTRCAQARAALDLDKWRAAMALVRGPVLADIPAVASHPAVVAAAAEVGRAVLDYADLALAKDSAADAIGPLTSALDADPGHEGLCLRLMQAQWDVGESAAALDAFRRTRRFLVGELGIEPGADLQGRYERILRADRVPEPAVPEQLPADIGDFTGRDSLVDRLASGAGPHRFAIGGSGGIGKTTLAVHAGHLIKDRYPDGQLFVDLRGMDPQPRSAGDVLAGFLDALDADRLPDRLEDRASLFRSLIARRRVLVILDNAADSAALTHLLPGGEDCGVLITSRQAIADLPAVQPIQLSTFSDTEAHALFGRVVDADRVRAEPAAVRDVVTACGGLPLALRITGARLVVRPQWTIRSLAARLEDSTRLLDELQVGTLAARSCFGLSYDALPEEDARAFRMLALWPGADISDSVADALFGEGKGFAATVLERLVDVGLVDVSRPGRFRLHDLLRAFAAELVAKIDTDTERRAALRRLVDFFHVSAVNSTQWMRKPSERYGVGEYRGTSPYAPEFDSDAAVTAWRNAEFNTTVVFLEMAKDLTWIPAEALASCILNVSGMFRSGNDRMLVEKSLRWSMDAASRSGLRQEYAVAAAALASGMAGRFQLSEAYRLSDEVSQIFAETGTVRRKTMASLLRAYVYLAGRRDDEAYEAAMAALRVAREHQLPVHELLANAYAGAAAGRLGHELSRVQQFLERYLELEAGDANRKAGAEARLDFADALAGRREFDLALRLIDEGILIADEYEYVSDRCGLLAVRARVLRQCGRIAEARSAATNAVKECRAAYLPIAESLALLELGRAEQLLGDADAARARWLQAHVQLRGTEAPQLHDLAELLA